MSSAYHSAAVRRRVSVWSDLPWVDLPAGVFRERPVTVRGAFNLGMKAVGKAMHGAGLTSTSWGDGPVEGKGAMVGAWWRDAEAERLGSSMREVELTDLIREYNEVDCKVMMEVLSWLRPNR